MTQLTPKNTIKIEALVTKDESGVYVITFPDFPGCATQAESETDIVSQAHEAVVCHMQGMVADGDEISIVSGSVVESGQELIEISVDRLLVSEDLVARSVTLQGYEWAMLENLSIRMGYNMDALLSRFVVDGLQRENDALLDASLIGEE